MIKVLRQYADKGMLVTETKNLDAKGLLDAWQAGDSCARDELIERLYTELRQISGALLNREGGISLTTGDLVNEAVIRLIGLKHIDWQDKAHFMAMSARTMRRVLIDHARKKGANRRKHQKVTLVTHLMGGNQESIDINNLETALTRLQVIDEDRAKIVEMRYYGGLSLEEIAEVMGVSTSTVQRSWRVSRAWLLKALKDDRQHQEL